MKRIRLGCLVFALALCVSVPVVSLAGCGGSLRHAATVADATALSATLAADDFETAAYKAGQVPIAAHKAFSVELARIYQAEIDIAKLIKVGGDPGVALTKLVALRAAVASALAALPDAIRIPVATNLNKVVAVVSRSLGQ